MQDSFKSIIINRLNTAVNQGESLDDFTDSESELTKDATKQLQNLHTDISNRSVKLAEDICKQWLIREYLEGGVRLIVAVFLLWALWYQLSRNMLFLYSLGTGELILGPEVVIGYFVTFMGQLVGVIVIIMKYIYNERSTKSLEIIKELVVSICNNNRHILSEKAEQLKNEDENKQEIG